MTVLRSPLRTALRSSVYSPLVGKWGGEASVGARLRSRLNSGRVDFIGIGDSNQLLSGYGWDHGFQYALSQVYPMWATGLVSQNENNGSGANQGYGYNRVGSLIGAISGAPSDLDQFLNKGSGALYPADYTYVADGASAASSISSGLILGAGSVLDNGAALAFDIHYGTFTTGAGQFRASARLEQSPYSLLVANAARSTNTGAFGMAVETVTLSADATRAAKAISGKPILVNTTGITGPYFNTYYRFRNPGRTTGWSYGTLDARGGQSLRTMAYDLQQASDETLTHYFGILRADQGDGRKTVVIVINSGLNDRNETNASVGPAAVADGDSAGAFVDNTTAIVNRVYEIWDANDWPRSELFWIFMPSHPVSTPDDAELLTYRAAIQTYAETIPNAIAVDLDAVTTQSGYVANGWYASGGGDVAHLTQTGYQAISALVIESIGIG